MRQPFRFRLLYGFQAIKNPVEFNWVCCNGARGRNRTGTDVEVRGILSPLCLPISPPGLLRSWRLTLLNGGGGRNRTGVDGFAGRCITTLPPRHKLIETSPVYDAKTENLTWTKKCRRIRHKNWSGKRDSNSRPRPWQGRALPTELFPQLIPA